MKRSDTLAALCLGALLLTGPAALAQDAPPPPSMAASEAPAGNKPVTWLDADDKLQDMRYRHLWIAYGVVWFLVFGFVWRTWNLQQTTSKELDDLRGRIADLEENRHG